MAVMLHWFLQWLTTLPFIEKLIHRFIWWGPNKSTAADDFPRAMVLYSDTGESVEWVNMCWRKAWRVYQRGLERWLADLLQPVFDNLCNDGSVPSFVHRLRILEFTLDHDAPYFSNMRRRTSRKDSDLNGVVDVRYTGGARMLLLIEVGRGRWRMKLPVMVSDLDLECKMWIKLRLAPMCPYIGTLSLAFVGQPTVKVQLSSYNRVRLMRIPVIQAFLTKLLTIDLPALMVLPRRLEINIPPAVTAVAEAAVGRDAVMRAVASAVLQADALEHALMAALPLGPQSAAGGVSLPDAFVGELSVTVREARGLPVWGFPWQTNPYCRLTLGNQAVTSRRDAATSHAGRHRAPVWNQEFTFLVEDPKAQQPGSRPQTLRISIRDSHLTGRPDVGWVDFVLRDIPEDGTITTWLPVQPTPPLTKGEGEILLDLTYKPFMDDEYDSGYREAEALLGAIVSKEQQVPITDIKSAADASSRAAVAASAAAAAVAVTKAAAARAAAKAAAKLTKKVQPVAQTSNGKDSSGNGSGPPPGGGNGSRANVSATSSFSYTSSDEDDGGAASIGSALGGAVSSSVIERMSRAAGVSNQAMRELLEKSPSKAFPGVEYRITEEVDDDMPRGKSSLSSFPVDSLSPAPRPPPPRSGTTEPVIGASDSAPSMQQAQEEQAGLVKAAASGHVLESLNEDEVGTILAMEMAAEEPDGELLSALNKQLQSAGAAPLPFLSSDSDAEEKGPAGDGEVGRLRSWWGAIKGWWQKKPEGSEGSKGDDFAEPPREVVEAIVIPPDLPLEAIAQEVHQTIQSRQVQEAARVDMLLHKAMERSERPWLMLLSALSLASVTLLIVVFLRLEGVIK